jgi:hypothetical protein
LARTGRLPFTERHPFASLIAVNFRHCNVRRGPRLSSKTALRLP